MHATSPIFLVVLGTLVGCAGVPKGKPEAPPPPHVASDEEVCPMYVDGTRVTPELVHRGTAYVFRTTTDVAELRRRVRVIARLHDERPAHQRGNIVAATDDIPDGVRLNLTPAHDGQLEPLLAHAMTRADLLGQGYCPSLPTPELVVWLVADPRTDQRTVVTSR